MNARLYSTEAIHVPVGGEKRERERPISKE